MDYLPEVECQITEGVFGWDLSVSLINYQGRSEFLSVPLGMVNKVRDKTYLAIDIIRVDYDQEMALIELPSETDSGAWRMWMTFSSFRPDEEKEKM